MAKKRISVLRGGPSGEYDVSLQTGATILASLSPEKYHIADVLIDKEGNWHINGVAKPINKILDHTDVVVNALHGNFGEDGKLQHILDTHDVAYTGSGAFPSAVAMNKAHAKKIILDSEFKIKTPVHKVIKKGEHSTPREAAIFLFRNFPQPSVIKPVDSGSSLGVSIAQTIEQIEKALINAFSHSNTVIVEEFISGQEATCGVIDGYRGHDVYPLIPVEIIKPSESEFFDYEAKYGGKSIELCPGNFSPEQTAEIQRLAIAAHKALGLSHYSRSDFIVHPKRGVYFLETNTLPGMTKESLFPKGLKAVGSSIGEFLDHIIQLAFGRK